MKHSVPIQRSGTLDLGLNKFGVPTNTLQGSILANRLHVLHGLESWCTMTSEDSSSCLHRLRRPTPRVHGPTVTATIPACPSMKRPITQAMFPSPPKQWNELHHSSKSNRYRYRHRYREQTRHPQLTYSYLDHPSTSRQDIVTPDCPQLILDTYRLTYDSIQDIDVGHAMHPAEYKMSRLSGQYFPASAGGAYTCRSNNSSFRLLHPW